jgi:ribosomal protein L4
MPVVDVVNLDGKKVGQVELADAVFGAEINTHLLHEASRWYLNSLRRGTAKTKDKRAVRALARSGLLCGAMVEQCTGRSRAHTHMRCRRKWFLGHCVRRSRRNLRSRN